MRVALVSGGFPPRIGGVESYVYNLSRALAQRGHEVTVFTYMFGDVSVTHRVDDRLRREGVRVQRVGTMPTGLQSHHINSHYTRFAPALASLLRREDADIIDTHSYPALHTDIAFKASRAKCAPCIIHVHGMYKIHRLHHLAAGQRELDEVEGVIVNNKVQRSLLSSNGTPTDKIHVIPPGINYERFARARRSNIRKTGKSILFMGRVVEAKGLGLLVDAAPDVLKEHPDAEFRVVGIDHGYADAARSLAARRGVLRHFNFLGGKKGDDVVDEYARCRLLALPSRHEGFGMVVLESLASGRPAAITNFEGSHWFTSSGACLVSRRGDSKQLSDNLNRILEDDEMTDEMSRSGQKFAEQFDWAQIAARHEKIYVKTLNPGLL